MVETFVAELRGSVSAARLERYRRGGTDFDMVTNSFWNIALVESLFHPLGSVEILLRNAIHRTLSRHYGMTNWYDERGFFEPAQVRQINDAKRFISDRNRPVTPDRVIAQPTFGFWVTLLSRNYNNRFWRSNHAANLRLAFPHVPKGNRQRAQIQAKYVMAHRLRNLAVHHEPILERVSLQSDHQQIYEAMAWIDPTMTGKVRMFDRFEQTYQHGWYGWSAIAETLRFELDL